MQRLKCSIPHVRTACVCQRNLLTGVCHAQSGETPLCVAISSCLVCLPDCLLELIELLLASGADIRASYQVTLPPGGWGDVLLQASKGSAATMLATLLHWAPSANSTVDATARHRCACPRTGLHAARSLASPARCLHNRHLHMVVHKPAALAPCTCHATLNPNCAASGCVPHINIICNRPFQDGEPPLAGSLPEPLEELLQRHLPAEAGGDGGHTVSVFPPCNHSARKCTRGVAGAWLQWWPQA
jgi:hypothetical protein